MRAFSKTLLGVAILLSAAQPHLGAKEFSDVPSGHWAEKDIEKLTEEGLLEGWQGKFHGTRPFDRYQMAKVLRRYVDRLDREKARIEAELRRLAGEVRAQGEAQAQARVQAKASSTVASSPEPTPTSPAEEILMQAWDRQRSIAQAQASASSRATDGRAKQYWERYRDMLGRSGEGRQKIGRWDPVFD